MPFRRVLVIDDSPIARKVVSEVVTSIPGVSDVVTASNGRLGLERLSQDRFDLVILDVEMPEMDGIATLRVLRHRHPDMPVLMFSSLTERAGTLTLEALALGARDYLTKPSNLGPHRSSAEQMREQLAAKIRGILPTDPEATPATPAPVPTKDATKAAPARTVASRPAEIVAIGASTGGPVAITEILTRMPASLTVPIVMVQHMPAFFTRLFAKRLDELAPIPVVEAESGMALETGRAYVAPGDFHLRVERQAGVVRLVVETGQPENSCRPAVDVLFRSVAETFGPASLAVVLTGMGEDGMRGARVLRERGGRVLAQDQPSSVVWGMPGAVSRAGLADRVASLAEMPTAILEAIRSERVDRAGNAVPLESRR